MPTIGVHVSDDVVTKIQKKADDRYRGKRSAYIAELIERDLEGAQSTPDAMSETILVDLARDLIGKIDAEDLAKNLEGKDQRRELQRILRAMSQTQPTPPPWPECSDVELTQSDETAVNKLTQK